MANGLLKNSPHSSGFPSSIRRATIHSSHRPPALRANARVRPVFRLHNESDLRLATLPLLLDSGTLVETLPYRIRTKHRHARHLQLNRTARLIRQRHDLAFLDVQN